MVATQAVPAAMPWPASVLMSSLFMSRLKDFGFIS